MKIAIVGAGPRGLWAIEELIARSRKALDIVVFDPFPPGAGAVYREDQPANFRLNLRSSAVKTAFNSLDQWRVDQGYDPDPFPPRALVGKFLAASWQAALERAPEHIQIRYEAHTITEIIPDENSGYEIAGDVFDEVLVVTGHEHDHPGALRNSDSAVPVTPLYWNANLPDNPATIGVRGAALTFIDVCMLYGQVATKIYPVNRSGRFMEVKLDPTVVVPELDPKFSQRVLSCANATELAEILAEAAVTLADCTLDQVQDVIKGEDFTGDAVAELRQSLAVARGDLPLSPAGAVGAALRELYPAIIKRHQHAGPIPGYVDLSRPLERVAFGPPPYTAQVLLDLIDSQVVDTQYLGHPDIVAEWMVGSQPVDVLIDAVLPPQGQASVFADIPGITIIGRMNEHIVPGHDSLNRTLLDEIPRWAARISSEDIS
ncbi:FAD/NAD(P)-binding protein [Corynebacterium sp. ES2794-CONJ1]|uniref:FAD/NAD(P)-binding protein n=1 Tax=unclassified Corynebacterium TaxID=2624378 RepID=UPI0021696055|nr:MULTISPECIES: FAD/NAD(P)-binding domain-containing protein [unclassified Corynebacterium]MCS4490410.1 FAD/NAD(P)-binding protein [Corynebacterium sp. ES2775-CONJ]MCS4492190.1 FAD/NAD(P)-binding protein [Corynebacterium sp. ES2715-CONJ3]MCS4532328.1 FAD/NAD(P)-binding protein [Corynebacterium sp. ES2730-CONJ]MCU9519709.1 FAD/NAD(P)-binding protein [Corynebacterium sp. ES2794-CONJ1]